MLFNFQLRPLSEVTPWVYQGHLYLHWFGLTEGWYWLHVNEKDEIFRYSPELLSYWQQEYLDEPRHLPYADYYVVRFWQDLLDILPRILEPLPPRLAQLLATEEQVNQWQERIRQWETLFEPSEEEEETEEEEQSGREIWDTYLQASSWWYDRQLDTHPLIAGPRLWFWNNDQHIHACWDNREQDIDTIPAWTAQKGQIHLTRAQFLDEVQAFHGLLFAEMASRIQEMKATYQPGRTDRAPMPDAFSANRSIYAPLPQKGEDPEERFWPYPDIALDLAKLEKEQLTRFQRLASSFGRVSSGEEIQVNAVFNAMTKMDRFAGLS
ncbi:hypothetical protein KSC_003970 [Ktedonobacter sp. SOSP1-52]|uniref:DUF5984 family protein n=1 Tax=Ktedonobacter sp. SOSP1-52 TaxID=2778366 RepID=UPI001A22897E|nr:DUF5984 family protein [Ktedonobacter sp. SOSP1-52]GHO61505.1 hypothetical protein KSC_003970 [Ktedonobacter sp. SOSP1-52]